MPASKWIAIAGNNLKSSLRQDLLVGTAHPTFLIVFFGVLNAHNFSPVVSLHFCPPYISQRHYLPLEIPTAGCADCFTCFAIRMTSSFLVVLSMEVIVVSTRSFPWTIINTINSFRFVNKSGMDGLYRSAGNDAPLPLTSRFWQSWTDTWLNKTSTFFPGIANSFNNAESMTLLGRLIDIFGTTFRVVCWFRTSFIKKGHRKPLQPLSSWVERSVNGCRFCTIAMRWDLATSCSRVASRITGRPAIAREGMPRMVRTVINPISFFIDSPIT